MKQRKKITRVPNMQNLKQKRQKVNLQMSRQRNTDNIGRKMRNNLPTRDIRQELNATLSRLCDVKSTVEKTTLP
jgi:hypothetical protein